MSPNSPHKHLIIFLASGIPTQNGLADGYIKRPKDCPTYAHLSKLSVDACDTQFFVQLNLYGYVLQVIMFDLHSK